MYTILIVDDEWLVREGLKQTIPWEKLHCQVIAEASNGSAALPLIAAHQPDIVITDIRMPKMDGLQLAAEVPALHAGAKIVFLTGFDEFEYARQAIKIGAADFVLKPTDPDELMRVIGQVTRQIDSERQQMAYNNQLQVQMDHSLPLLMEKLLYHALLDHVRNEERIVLEEMIAVPFTRQFPAVQVALVEWEGGGAMPEWLEPLLHCIKREDGSAGHGCIVSLQDRIAVVLAEQMTGKEQDDVQTCLKTLAASGHAVTIGVSRPNHTLATIASAYREALACLQQKTYLGTNYMLFVADLDQIRVKEKYGLSDIKQYLDMHYHEELSLQQFAASLHMSESNFSKVFKKYAGASFVEYVAQLRIDKAKELLMRPDAKIYEVSVAVGYQDPRYFSQIFRKLVGETPSDFRRGLGFADHEKK